MATSSEEVRPEYGDDSPPLFARVADKPYCRGCVTSEARTASQQYIEFLRRHHKEVNRERE